MGHDLIFFDEVADVDDSVVDYIEKLALHEAEKAMRDVDKMMMVNLRYAQTMQEIIESNKKWREQLFSRAGIGMLFGRQ